MGGRNWGQGQKDYTLQTIVLSQRSNWQILVFLYFLKRDIYISSIPLNELLKTHMLYVFEAQCKCPQFDACNLNLELCCSFSSKFPLVRNRKSNPCYHPRGIMESRLYRLYCI